MCLLPLRALRSEGGIEFDSSGDLRIPCGQCYECRRKKGVTWANRIYHESLVHDFTTVATLTYSEDPYSLNLEDPTNFLKRLRKKIGRISYYYVGEYGDHYSRPHYHFILFGAAFPDRKYLKKTDKDVRLYTSELLESVWGKGFCPISDFEPRAAYYVTSYFQKKLTGSLSSVYNGRMPEFARMSRRPAIGRRFYDRFRSDIYSGDGIVVGGQIQPTCRYYDRRLAIDDPEYYDTIISKRENLLTDRESNYEATVRTKTAFKKTLSDYDKAAISYLNRNSKR